MTTRQWRLDALQETQALAARLASHVHVGMVFLHGDLGAGKTELVRAWLRALGVTGTVRSPTYTLVEPYPLGDRNAYHLDLYRLADPEELEFLGLRDWAGEQDALILVEWPERGDGVLPAPDLRLHFELRENSRIIGLSAETPRACQWLAALEEE